MALWFVETQLTRSSSNATSAESCNTYSERHANNNLNIPVALTIHKVKEFLVVDVLVVPVIGTIIAEVVT